MEELRLPKYKVVSSHIGRRSFACNSILAGVPKRIIMICRNWFMNFAAKCFDVKKKNGARDTGTH